MCKFITVTVNDDINLADFDRLTKGAFAQLTDAVVLPKLPKRSLYFVRRGLCQCHSAIGSTSQRTDGPYTEEELAEVSQRGGNPAKLERWKRRRIDAYQSRVDSDERIRSSPEVQQETAEWLEMAAAVLSHPYGKRFGIMHHLYSGRIDTDDFDIATAPTLSIHEAIESILLDLAENVLQEFTR